LPRATPQKKRPWSFLIPQGKKRKKKKKRGVVNFFNYSYVNGKKKKGRGGKKDRATSPSGVKGNRAGTNASEEGGEKDLLTFGGRGEGGKKKKKKGKKRLYNDYRRRETCLVLSEKGGEGGKVIPNPFPQGKRKEGGVGARWGVAGTGQDLQQERQKEKRFENPCGEGRGKTEGSHQMISLREKKG